MSDTVVRASAVDAVVGRAAGSGFSSSSLSDRMRALTALATALEAARDELVAIAAAETHLTPARLSGEVTRTANQLRFFAEVVGDGGFLEAAIDHADPSTTPPRPDLRRMLRPLGVVAVFTASNFPFAFSVLGNDTASALAAGCPVVVKAHPGHPRLSERTAELAADALAAAGVSADAIGLVDGVDAGVELVRHPLVAAVAFTGSEHGGRALFEVASSRPDPIPFYGELGSINPVVVTEAAASEDAAGLAAGLLEVVARDAGQFCTKPGLVFAPADSGFGRAVHDALAGAAAHPLLTTGMTRAFEHRVGDLSARGDVAVARAGGDADGRPTVVSATVAAFLADPDALIAECFGPLTAIVSYASDDELRSALALLPNSLTATIRSAQGEDVSDLAAILAPRCGRLVFGGWPTGVATAWAQHHGGAWPATTGSQHTSVGASSLRRFLTPVAYQNAPEAVLPTALLDANPLRIPRREDGRLVLATDS
ncbi:aldehyde dehydrogenase family protein [Leifsonia sp. NPDC102414]|uniref:aldehyde dehydrogenase family protein n=1 Tax=Leifsonia sp. NPDC102414 TaxID=3364124 RepID=UPI00381435DE